MKCTTHSLSVVVVASLSLAIFANASDESQWRTVFMDYQQMMYQPTRFEIAVEDWVADHASGSVAGTVVFSSDPERDSSFNNSVREGNSLIEIERSDGKVLPYGFVNAGGDFLFAHLKTADRQQRSHIFGFRTGAADDADIQGEWQGFIYEVELAQSNELTDWNYELVEVTVVGPDEIRLELKETSRAEDLEHIGNVRTIEYSRNGSYINVDDMQLAIASCGDLIVGASHWSDDIQTASVIVLMKAADPTVLTMEQVAGVWALGSVELGKGENQFGPWTHSSGGTIMVELNADGSGQFYGMDHEAWDPEDDEGAIATAGIGWALDGSSMVITALMGEPLDDGPSFLVGESTQIMRAIEVESDSDELFIMAEYGVKISRTVPNEVKYIPLFNPRVSYWGEWNGSIERVYTKEWPWLYFESAGWIYIAEGTGNSVWLYDYRFDEWFHTDGWVFPFMIGTYQAAPDVIYLDLEESTPLKRWVYSFVQGRWLTDR
ncbi:MAG: hypothetical protein JJU20_02990 [Opitutales bacterium]|nr:hypothetical protein [Opitutales bacterium]